MTAPATSEDPANSSMEATPVDTSAPIKPVVRVGSNVKVKTKINSKTLVRKGTVIHEDHSDMPYKVKFHDDLQPEADWVHHSVVEHHDSSQVNGSMPSASLQNGNAEKASEWTDEGLEMIAKHEGEYSRRAGGAVITCCYIFLMNGQIRDDDSDDYFGTFSCSRIDNEQVMVATAPVTAPCIQIVDSDVIAEMQKPENKGAFFVMPSSAKCPPEAEGPRALFLGAHPAVAAFVRDNAASASAEQGVNAVREVLAEVNKKGFALKLVNGCLKVPRMDRPQQAAALEVLRNSMHLLRIPTIEDVPVGGLLPDESGFSDAKHSVNLVYPPVVPVETLNETQDPDQQAFQAKVAELLLIGHYYGALKKAAERGEGTKIFLIPLAAKSQDMAIPANSISSAIDRISADELIKLQIYAITWSGNQNESSTLTGMFRDCGKLGPRMRPVEATPVILERHLLAIQPTPKKAERATHRLVSDHHGRRPAEIHKKLFLVKFLSAASIFMVFYILECASASDQGSRIPRWMGPSCACVILTCINIWTLISADMLEWY
mmetsp:Transcript_18650/g.33346  ORF Transcript_18650/g.33346 Transcript_18650/m.33346 type:complete len:546 (-) Transcript_18650:71-1708(-)